MTEEKQKEVRAYLRSWSEQDWELVDDLYNDGVPLPAAVVRVHRFKQSAGPVEAVTIAIPVPALEQPELLLA